jgi:hypothetical protein
MRIEVESFEPFDSPRGTLVRIRTAAGTIAGPWISDYEPELGEQYDVEFDTDPTCVWGSDVTDAQPDEPDSIRQTEDGYEFVGQTEPVLAHELEHGIFHLRIADSLFTFDAEGLPADAGGRRYRVRQQTLKVFPFGFPPRTEAGPPRGPLRY